MKSALIAHAAAPTWHAAQAGEAVNIALPACDWHPGQTLTLHLTDKQGLPSNKQLRLKVISESTVPWARGRVGLVLLAQLPESAT